MNEDEICEVLAACVHPSRRAAFRRAHRRYTEEGGSDDLLGQFVIILDATAAFVLTIPAELAAVMTDGREDMVVAIQDAVEEGAKRISFEVGQAHGHLLGAFREQVQPDLAAAASSTRRQEACLRELASTVAAQHADRRGPRLLLCCGALVGALLTMLVLGIIPAVRNAKTMERHGISLHSERRGDHIVVRVTGPTVRSGTEWTRDSDRNVCGAEIWYQITD